MLRDFRKSFFVFSPISISLSLQSHVSVPVNESKILNKQTDKRPFKRMCQKCFGNDRMIFFVNHQTNIQIIRILSQKFPSAVFVALLPTRRKQLHH